MADVCYLVTFTLFYTLKIIFKMVTEKITIQIVTYLLRILLFRMDESRSLPIPLLLFLKVGFHLTCSFYRVTRYYLILLSPTGY